MTVVRTKLTMRMCFVGSIYFFYYLTVIYMYMETKVELPLRFVAIFTNKEPPRPFILLSKLKLSKIRNRSNQNPNPVLKSKTGNN